MINTNALATAFVSCSLREEDRPFINYVIRILERHRIKPFGTVGMLSAAPVNIAEHMKENIPLADFVVIVATPRYLQKDLRTGQVNFGLSEMVHVETGMAFMANKPVIVFVQQGTSIGSFLPNITQYVELNGDQMDLESKWNLINSLLGNAHNVVQKKRSDQSSKEAGNLLTASLAIFGGLTIANSLFAEEKPKRKKPITKRRTYSKK